MSYRKIQQKVVRNLTNQTNFWAKAGNLRTNGSKEIRFGTRPNVCRTPFNVENWKFWTFCSMSDYCWGEFSWAYESSCLLNWSIWQLNTFAVNWFLLSRISFLHFFGHLGAHLFFYLFLWLRTYSFESFF